MEQTKKTNDAELINEVMRAAGKLREHEVPTGWPEMYRTGYAIKLAYALEAAGYLNEDWKPTPKLDNEKAVYVLWEFGDPRWRPSVYPLIDYWNIDVAGVKATKDSNFKSEINAIVAELREEAEAEIKASLYCPPENNYDTGEEAKARYKKPTFSIGAEITRNVTLYTIEALEDDVRELVYQTLIESERWDDFREAVRNCITESGFTEKLETRLNGMLITKENYSKAIGIAADVRADYFDNDYTYAELSNTVYALIESICKNAATDAVEEIQSVITNKVIEAYFDRRSEEFEK